MGSFQRTLHPDTPHAAVIGKSKVRSGGNYWHKSRGPCAHSRSLLKRMRELNYQPDWIARSMVTRRTYLVGLVLPDLMHSFFAEVAKGVVVRAFPRVEDEVALVTNGLDGMPAWGGQLTKVEIEAVVQYTREGL